LIILSINIKGLIFQSFLFSSTHLSKRYFLMNIGIIKKSE